MPYLSEILDEITKKTARFVLERSVTDRCFKVKAIYSFKDKDTACRMFEKLSTMRGPKVPKPAAPAPRKQNRKPQEDVINAEI